MQLPVTFSVPPEHTLDALEAVLAIARRTGLRLGALDLRSGAPEDLVYLELRTQEAGPLELFLARLHNVIGIDCRPGAPAHLLSGVPCQDAA